MALAEPRTAVRARALVDAVPVWAWLAGLVAVSAVARFLLARAFPAPWIFVDELIYSELAKSVADGQGLAIREVSSSSYGFLYPVVLSPAWAVFDSVPHAYAAAKAINAVVMSSAAVPAYLLARRVLARGSSLAVAVLALALPSLVYTGTIMTENAFYPVFLWALLAVVLVLEKPSTSHQLWALTAIAAAFVTRVQAVALVAALASAIVLLAALEARGKGVRWFLRRLGAYRLTWLALGGGVCVLALVQVARGRPVTEILGAYRAAGRVGYSVEDVARWILYHVAEIDLYLGVAPFAAFLLVAALAFRRSERSRELRVLFAAAVPAAVWLAVLVGTFASQPSVSRIQERNLFYVAPLAFVALFVWIERGCPRPPAYAGPAATLAAGLPAVLPFFELINQSAVSDTLALLPWWNLQDSVIDGRQVRLVASLCAVAAGALFLYAPRRFAPALPALLLVYFAVVSVPVADRIERASVGSLWSGIRVEREWIDSALPDGAEAVAIWSGGTTSYAIWENEFFNRAVGRVYAVGEPLPGNLPETEVEVDERTGRLLAGGRPVEAAFALSDGSFPLDGDVVAQDPGVGVTLYRVGGPLVLAARIEGLYPNDTWSGAELAYTRLGCRGGSLTVTLVSDPQLFSAKQTVTATVAGGVTRSVRIDPASGETNVTVPLAAVGGRCRVDFTVAPTAVPAEVVGGGDTRELGVHFTSFRYAE
jgi:hypothetical protein